MTDKTMDILEKYHDLIQLCAQQRERSIALFHWCQECESRGEPNDITRGQRLLGIINKNRFQHNTYIWMVVALEWYPADQFFDDNGNCL